MFSKIRQDLKANNRNLKGKVITISFRAANFFAQKKNLPTIIIGLPIRIAHKVIIEWVLGVEIPAKTRIGPGLTIYHGQGLVVNDGSVIGKNVILRHCTTIGNKIDQNGTPSACPIIGDNVEIGSNVTIIGPIRIGNNARIGAGSVIVKDVPADTTAIGNPARLIPHNKEQPLA